MKKARLVKEGKIKKEKPVVAVHADTAPYAIPENWKWVRLGALTEVITKGCNSYIDDRFFIYVGLKQ